MQPAPSGNITHHQSFFTNSTLEKSLNIRVVLKMIAMKYGIIEMQVASAAPTDPYLGIINQFRTRFNIMAKTYHAALEFAFPW